MLFYIYVTLYYIYPLYYWYQLTSKTVSKYGKKYRIQHGKILKTKDI